MLIMAEIRFEENGQGFFDFEYLLNITNELFVNRIKSQLSLVFKNDIKIIENELYVTVIIQHISTTIYKFYKEDKIITYSNITPEELRNINQMVTNYDKK